MSPTARIPDVFPVDVETSPGRVVTLWAIEGHRRTLYRSESEARAYARLIAARPPRRTRNDLLAVARRNARNPH
jgi:hypothetical protein